MARPPCSLGSSLHPPAVHRASAAGCLRGTRLGALFPRPHGPRRVGRLCRTSWKSGRAHASHGTCIPSAPRSAPRAALLGQTASFGGLQQLSF